MAGHILDHDSLTAGDGANTANLRSIFEILEVRTRHHMGLSQSSYYGDRQRYHSWMHETH